MLPLARRLLSVIPVAAVFCLVLTGATIGATPRASGFAARRVSYVQTSGSPVGGPVTAAVTAARSLVGPIPGASRNTAYRWTYAPGRGGVTSAVSVRPLPMGSSPSHPSRLRHLLQADVLVVAGKTLPSGLLARIRRVNGIVAAVPVDAGRVRVNGVFVNVLGVNPSAFRPFAAGPTARSGDLWANVAAGGMAISYTMGRQDKLSLAKPVQVTGARKLPLPVAGFGTVGIGGVDAVVSLATARSLGLPAQNAFVISAPHTRLDRLIAISRSSRRPGRPRRRW